MGIAMVGMTRATRPATMKLAPENYFAFRKEMIKKGTSYMSSWMYTIP